MSNQFNSCFRESSFSLVSSSCSGGLTMKFSCSPHLHLLLLTHSLWSRLIQATNTTTNTDDDFRVKQMLFFRLLLLRFFKALKAIKANFLVWSVWRHGGQGRQGLLTRRQTTITITISTTITIISSATIRVHHSAPPIIHAFKMTSILSRNL